MVVLVRIRGPKSPDMMKQLRLQDTGTACRGREKPGKSPDNDEAPAVASMLFLYTRTRKM